MPKIGCPACRKIYELPGSALGKVATCKCGKSFRVVQRASSGNAEVATQDVVGAEPPSASAAPDDSFWDDALDESMEVEAPAVEPVNRMAREALEAAEAEANKPAEKVRWGFQWEKFASGLGVMFLAGAGALAVFVSLGSIRLTAVLLVVAFGGLFTAISGLMGEEGIW